MTITALDPFGNIASGYRGTVSLVGSDTRSNLPGTYTFTAADSGRHTFSTTFKTAGPQSITVSDPNTRSPGPARTSPCMPGFLASFTVAGFPSTTAGVSQSFTVTARDAFGNIAHRLYRAGGHSAAAMPRPCLPAGYTFTAADAGVHTFTATLKTAGLQSLTVNDLFTPTLAGTEAAIPVTAAAAASFTVAGFPATTAGVAQSFTVTARTPSATSPPAITGTVSFGSSDAQAGLPASYTFTAADAGVHIFSATLKTAGNQSITVKDAASPTVAGSQSGIAVTAAALARFALSISTTPLVGKSFTVTVAAVDAFGNVIIGYRGKVHFSDSAANAGLPSDFTFSNNDNGVHTFTVTLNTAGTQTLTVFDTSNGSIAGSLTRHGLVQDEWRRALTIWSTGRTTRVVATRAACPGPVVGRRSIVLVVVAEDRVGVVRAGDQLLVLLAVAGRGGEEGVEHGHQVAGQDQGDEHPADDHDRQRLLGLRADRGRERGREQPERGGQRGDDHRPDPQLGPPEDRLADRQAGGPELVEVRDQEHAVLHGHAEDRDEPDRRRDAERRVR